MRKEDYYNLTTGQQLVDEGVIPKSSTDLLALAVNERLLQMKANLEELVDESLLARWESAVTVETGNYVLKSDLVASETLGHFLRIGIDHAGVPAGTVAQLVQSNPSNGHAKVKITAKNGSTRYADLTLSQVGQHLEASTMGQIIPRTVEETIEQNAIGEFFPTTKLDFATSRNILTAVLMGKDMYWVGPPGTGKTQLQEDFERIYKQIGVTFAVRYDDGEKCQVNCNPFSVFSEEYANRVVEMCQVCENNYAMNKDHNITGRIDRPSAEDVQIVVVTPGEGHGIQTIAGSGLSTMDVLGIRMPDLEGRKRPQGSMDGVVYGAFPKTNNGITFVSELDKMKKKTRLDTLDAIQSEEAAIGGVDKKLPTHSVVIASGNAADEIADALNDRCIFIRIDKPTGVEDNAEIMRRAFYGMTFDVDDINIGDVHRIAPLDIPGEHPVPVFYGKALYATYIAFDAEYSGSGKLEIMTATRSKKDAMEAASVLHYLDGLFYDRPVLVTPENVVAGIEYAMFTRINLDDRKEYETARYELSEFIRTTYHQKLQEEVDTWWCQALKTAAITAREDVRFKENYIAEFQQYERTEGASAFESHQAILHARNHPHGDQSAHSQYPLMSWMFEREPGQPGIERMNQTQVTELASLLVMTHNKSSRCKIENLRKI